MSNLMRFFDTVSPANQDIARDMSNAAREAMRAYCVQPRNDDDAARFDEACAVFLTHSIAAQDDDLRGPIGNTVATPADD